MFHHRLGALLGLSIEDVLALPERELERWQLYWNEEPWGPYRDNMHAASIIANLLRPHTPDGRAPDLMNFMFENPDDRRERERVATALKIHALANATGRASSPT